MAIIGRLDIITNEGYIQEALEQCEYKGLNKEQTALEIKKIIDEVVRLVSKNESLHLVSQQRELLEWLSNEDYFNIPKNEIDEILEDWKTYNSNCG